MGSITKNIYCISGLGADEKAFDRLEIKGYNLQHVQWLSPLANENLRSYSTRMLGQINELKPIILGLSFGGMIAIEIAKQIAVDKIILISTVKTYNEIPRWMKIVGALNLHKLIPIKSNRFTERADDKRMGIETIEEKNLINSYRKTADQKYIDWAVDQILNWKNTWVPDNTFHIHGENDQMFPLKNIRPTHIIESGTHIMVLNRAGEISVCIEEILSDS